MIAFEYFFKKKFFSSIRICKQIGIAIKIHKIIFCFVLNFFCHLAAYFYVGNTKRPTNQGAIRLRDERGSTGVIKRYRKKDITLSLPEGKTLRDIKWFSVWCDEFSVNFGDVSIPKSFDFPRPHKVGALNGVHGVSSDNIVIVDAQTILIPNFTYDGEAPG